MLTAAEAVKELARIHEQQAEQWERYGKAEDAAMIRRISRDYLDVVEPSIPEWVPLSHVATLKGWSPRKVRDLCKSKLGPEGLAKQIGRAGRWLIHRSAIDAIRPNPKQDDAPIDMSNIAETARRLGGGE